MRDYCLQEAQSRAAYGRLSLAVRMWRNWHMRKSLTQLLRLADEQPYDMGLPRALLVHLIAQPLTIDLAWNDERARILEARYGPQQPNLPLKDGRLADSQQQISLMPISKFGRYC
ncbi:MAG: hypothetical protein KGO94_01745 [Alphaproteobacteria bacterium]|nr:hypothetical protein [Alphaproteobacteria bacterium]